MEVAWTALALMAATLFGVLFYLGSKIDNINNRIDNLNATLSARIDALSAQLAAHLEKHAS
ncbi:MAG: hypothetical protein ACRDKT_03275 [Actinomycetota bacterium]